jgi:YidC/Oxa1 family membrane protein insertase
LEVINAILGIPLGYIFYFCYQIVPNYGLAILLFTLLTKVLMFPLSLVSQKNSIVMVKIQPALDEIKQRFAGNNTLILDEQKALYKREHYSMIMGILPLLLQIPIILGLICVIYNPLQHLCHLDSDTIRSLITATSQYLQISVDELGTGAQLAVMELVKSNPAALAALPDMQAPLAQIAGVDLDFLYTDMAMLPTFANLPTMLYPLLSGLSALALCVFQNKYNILQVNQGFWGKWGTAIFLTAFSLYFAYVLPCGVGLYWIAGNLLSMVVLALCNLVYNPKKYIDFSTLTLKPKLTPEQKTAEREQKKQSKALSRIDTKRFYKTPDKQLVFYSESSGFYKYFSRIITWLLDNSEITVHYVTSDMADQVFKLPANPRFVTYYVGQTALISFMMKLDADMVIMTMPDLETFHIKRSLVRKDIEYVYLDHGMTSFHLMLREHALDSFDTIFVYGPNHIAEVRRAEELHQLPEKKLVKTGYGLLDDLLEKVADLPTNLKNDPLIALIAPSWQKDNMMDLCLEPTVLPLLTAGFKVIVRPHPEYVKRFGTKLDEIIRSFEPQVSDGMLVFETNFSSNSTVFTADVVITDWSSIAQEFSYATKKPSIFINTPIKVMNYNWELLELEPLDITTRDQIGVSIDIDDLGTIGNVATQMVKQRKQYKTKITKVMNDNIYNIGSSAQATGEYIACELQAARQLREQQKAELEQKLAGILEEDLPDSLAGDTDA